MQREVPQSGALPHLPVQAPSEPCTAGNPKRAHPEKPASPPASQARQQTLKQRSKHATNQHTTTIMLLMLSPAEYIPRTKFCQGLGEEKMLGNILASRRISSRRRRPPTRLTSEADADAALSRRTENFPKVRNYIN